ncbi:MAG: hypothetical protein HDR31_01810 [Mycoplasma sp.]|nr:hypothetical protein [Mycoplasma sp.]
MRDYFLFLNEAEATNQPDLSNIFPTWLIILVGILVCIAIIGALYKIIAYRRISVVSKKLDYLVEDLIYKSEFMVPAVEALVKLSGYVDLIEGIVKKNSNALINYVDNNKDSVKKISKQVKEVIKENK